MDLKKHVDTIVIVGAVLVSFLGSFLWMNHKINELYGKINGIKLDIANVERELDRIKTVLIMQRIMPAELAQKENNNDSKN